MLPTIQHSCCPACQSKNINASFSVKDYTVSQQNFVVWNCNHCTLRFTQLVPTKENIGRFYKSENYISHTDTKKGLVSKLYHIVRNITLSSKRNLINKTTNNNKGNLLDIGAGTGAFAHTMQQNGWLISGLEPDEIARKIALEKYNIQLKPIEAFNNLQPNTYMVITLWHVLEHVHDLHHYFSQFKNLLVSQGKLIIAVPNYTSFDASWYKEYWAGYDVPRHLYHFSPNSIKLLAAQFGFTLVKQKKMIFDSFYVSLLSGKYKYGYLNVFTAFTIGLISNLNALLQKNKCSSHIYIFQKTT